VDSPTRCVSAAKLFCRCVYVLDDGSHGCLQHGEKGVVLPRNALTFHPQRKGDLLLRHPSLCRFRPIADSHSGALRTAFR
jgi:hypothetical protein